MRSAPIARPASTTAACPGAGTRRGARSPASLSSVRSEESCLMGNLRDGIEVVTVLFEGNGGQRTLWRTGQRGAGLWIKDTVMAGADEFVALVVVEDRT